MSLRSRVTNSSDAHQRDPFIAGRTGVQARRFPRPGWVGSFLARLSGISLGLCSGLLHGVPSAEQSEFFETRIRPVLIEKCYECHSAEAKKLKAGLNLDTREGWMKGGDHGTAIVPGDPEKSLLIKAIRYTDEDMQMPPQKAGGKLSGKQIADLEEWVRQGAPDPRTKGPEAQATPSSGVIAKAGTNWWSLQPVVDPIVPSVRDTNRVRNAIDHFILAKLSEKGLTPAPLADKRTLVRRAYFDLLGLPPSFEQMERFIADTSPEAWPKLIDELLESKHYGERWGRHWLDVARYADSGGYETDIYYRNAWRYRDYVVNSFNSDKPYDRFVQEQIAGDELWPNDLALDGTYKVAPEKLKALEARTGTGLYALGTQIHESNMDAPRRNYEILTDWVDTTGSAFMGLTFQCARCHDHKFDPISQRDWYALAAAFAGSKEVELPIMPGMGLADFKQHYPKILAADEARRAYQLFDNSTKGRTLTDAEKQQKQRLLEGIGNAVLALPQSDAQGVPFDGLMEIPTVSVLGHERPELVPVVRILNRGELSRPREAVKADLPGVLRAKTDCTIELPGPFGSRKQLALWLTSGKHPLTARVMVNRVWHWHFGRGIVGTPNDFGKMGEPPTHPELLDWLAGQLVQGGWSLKRLHRVIMTSATYQSESRGQDEGNSRIDAPNHYFWKANRRRLEAEAIWDNIHAVAGTLNLKMGGRPAVPPLDVDEQAPANWIPSADPAEHTRRGIYLLVRRNFRFPMFDVFDAPVNAISAPARDVTTVAPQALWFLNNRIAFRQAQQLAARVVAESPAGGGWNKPDFGPGQTGWLGVKVGPHAGWAKRHVPHAQTPAFDAPIGSVITHGETSVRWKVPAGDRKGTTVIRGGLWNVRHLGRSGIWKLWRNDTELLTEGRIDDSSGTSARPLSFSKGAKGESALSGIPSAPGDSFRLEVLEGDFVGVNLSFVTQTRVADLSTDFSLETNPTSGGWQYAESLGNGGGIVGSAVRTAPQPPAAPEPELARLVQKAWRFALGRQPSQEEQRESLAMLESFEKMGGKLDSPPSGLATLSPERAAALSKLCLALFNLNEFSYID